MTKTQIKKLIENGYTRFNVVTAHRGNRDHTGELLKQAMADERHFRNRWHVEPNAAPVLLNAQLMILRHIKTALDHYAEFGRVSVRARDLLHLKQPYVLTLSIVDEYHDEVAEMFADYDWAALESIDSSGGVLSADKTEEAA